MNRFARLILAAALAGGSSAAFAQAKEIKIAHIYGKTGALEAYGKQTQTGLMMGLEYATGGKMEVLGRKLVVIEKDDQIKPDIAKSALATAFGDDKVDIAVGPTSSASALAMLPVAEEYKKILLVEPAVADAITGDKWNRYIFRTGRSSTQDAVAAAVATPQNAQIAMLAQDYAFGRDGVKAVKEALAAIGSKATIIHEEYVPQATTDFTAPAQRMFDALKDKSGTKIIGIIWAGPHPLAKIADLKPERYGIQLAPGGNILPVMKGWKQFAGIEGAVYYYYGFPKNKVNDWLVAEHKKRFGGAVPDFFTAGGMAAGVAIVEAIKKAGSTDTEKLIAAMEGLSFETPKGTMTFRKEDHQAMQPMYHFRIKKAQADEWDLLELVREIPAKEIPLPVRNKR
ncbi:MAG TPA: substrate-binding domain-containing protein [Burkholderiales bacterium]|jgi:branched-chain amino acid transport system substrate-binding protein|nr:substrate-binding domain-containing protein [Burkholderiales bacterium]